MVSRRDFASVSIRFFGDVFGLFYLRECASLLKLLIDSTFELKMMAHVSYFSRELSLFGL